MKTKLSFEPFEWRDELGDYQIEYSGGNCNGEFVAFYDDVAALVSLGRFATLELAQAACQSHAEATA